MEPTVYIFWGDVRRPIFYVRINRHDVFVRYQAKLRFEMKVDFLCHESSLNPFGRNARSYAAYFM
jgi:hypothetical protein